MAYHRGWKAGTHGLRALALRMAYASARAEEIDNLMADHTGRGLRLSRALRCNAKSMRGALACQAWVSLSDVRAVADDLFDTHH